MNSFILIFLFYQSLDFVYGEGKIYGGYPIDITQAPYMAHVTYLLQVNNDGTVTVSDCGGSILRKNLILTAGHCTRDEDSGAIRSANKYTIRVSSSFIRQGGRTHNVIKVFTHPKFVGGTNNFHHDVGLLQLSDNINIDNSAYYTNLAHANDVIYPGTDGIVSGWGTNPDHPNDSQRLYQVHLTVISSTQCAKEFPQGDNAQEFGRHEVCAQSPGKSFCQGDSGGPFIDTRTGRQIGIVSYGTTDCTLPYPSVFSKVQDNLNFINSVIMQTRTN